MTHSHKKYNQLKEFFIYFQSFKFVFFDFDHRKINLFQ